jgi:hypothetical protein
VGVSFTAGEKFEHSSFVIRAVERIVPYVQDLGRSLVISSGWKSAGSRNKAHITKSM